MDGNCKQDSTENNDLSEFKRGVRAMFDYLSIRAANHWHGDKVIDAQCQKENDVVLEWAEDGLDELDDGAVAEWAALKDIKARLALAEKALTSAGYTQLSPANEWKPPLGPSASPLLQRIAQLLSERNATGVAIDDAIRGRLPKQHSMLNRLEMISNIAAQRDQLLAVIADHDRLVRELDVFLNGKDGAAKQASLCDLVAQAKKKASLLGLDGGLLIELDRQNVVLDCTKEVIRFCREELHNDDAAIFLRLWSDTEWEVLREEFPDADDIIYAADPLWSGWIAKGGAA